MSTRLKNPTEGGNVSGKITITNKKIRQVYLGCINDFVREGIQFDFEPDLRLRISSSKRVKGYCKFERDAKNMKVTYKVIEIGISSSQGWSERSLHRTMIHEMCHYVNAEKYNGRGHDDMFWSLMSRLGYPDGHFFSNEKVFESSMYSLDTSSFSKWQEVKWSDPKGKCIYEGIILRVNKRTCTVKERWIIFKDGKKVPSKVRTGNWRVPPNLLTPVQKIECVAEEQPVAEPIKQQKRTTTKDRLKKLKLKMKEVK